MALYISTYVIDIAALIYLLSMIHSGTSLNRYRKRPFIISIMLTIVIILSEAGTILVSRENINIREMNIFFNELGFSLSPMIAITIIFIVNREILKKYKILLLPSILNMVLTIVSPFLHFIFFIDGKNHYMRGTLFFVFILVYIVNDLILLLCTLELGKKYNYPIQSKMMLLFIFTMIGTSIQLINPAIHSTWHCITFTLFLYVIMMSEFDRSFDTLSGLYNRATFDRVAKEFTKTKNLSVIVLDIDDFKIMNDTYGHNYGDYVIRQVANIMRESFEKQYKCYRFGGDEFAIISEEVDVEKIKNQLQKMISILDEKRRMGTILPTVSFGYSTRKNEKNIDFDEVLKEADAQMYEAKANLEKKESA